MDLLKRSKWKIIPNLSNLSKIFHENEILSQRGVRWGGGREGSTEPRKPPLNPPLRSMILNVTINPFMPSGLFHQNPLDRSISIALVKALFSIQKY